jgi:hypothetical protein
MACISASALTMVRGCGSWWLLIGIAAGHRCRIGAVTFWSGGGVTDDGWPRSCIGAPSWAADYGSQTLNHYPAYRHRRRRIPNRARNLLHRNLLHRIHDPTPSECKSKPECPPRFTRCHSVFECPVHRLVRVHSVHGLSGVLAFGYGCGLSLRFTYRSLALRWACEGGNDAVEFGGRCDFVFAWLVRMCNCHG